MNAKTLLRQRLYNLQLSGSSFKTPAELVHHLGAVQAQDYEMSKWAVGMRLKEAGNKLVEDAIIKGEIIRTHIIRPTWHYVHPEDVRWMMALSAPYIRQQMGTYLRKLELDATVLKKSNKTIEKALRDGKQLIRTELATILNNVKIPTDDLRMNFLLINAEIDALICSGARRGKQITYALLDERVPPAKTKTLEESLATLALRYFNSHGPATLKDFTGWSGLPVTLARKGMNMVKEQLEEFTISGLQYLGPSNTEVPKPEIILLPNYDEYLVAYKDREHVYNTAYDEHLGRPGNPLFNNVILVDGNVAGLWKRTVKKDEVVVELTPFTSLNKTKVTKAVTAYKQFMK